MPALDLLDGVRVLELTAGAGRMTGRLLADLGAHVITTAPEPPAAGPDDAGRAADLFWSHRKHHLAPERLGTLTGVDVVLAGTDTAADALGSFDDAIWVWVTPFGRHGPRSSWQASELTCLAASGNLYPTGYPDLPPVACSQPTALAQGAADATIAALFALEAGRPAVVDVSIQEATVGANLGAHTTIHHHGFRGARVGPYSGGTREIWPCADGHVSFAIRGGPARAASWVALRDLLTEQHIDTTVLPQGDARSFDSMLAGPSTIDAISTVLAAFFAAHTKAALYGWARERNIMLAPVVGPDEIIGHGQLAHREFFDLDSRYRGFADHPIRSHDPASAGPAAPAAAPPPAAVPARGATGIWSGLRILEFGSAFAGPMASRYFAEHGATVIHVESARQPDSARLVASTPVDPDLPMLERSPLFPAVNANKLSVQLDMKSDEGREIAKRLAVEWADVLVENFSPRVLDGWGVGYAALSPLRPDLVYASSTLWGHDGPYANEKGFGGLGQAQSGHVYLTGYPDRDPVFPFGLITDSLTPKVLAAAVAAAIHRQRRTGMGCHLDASQIETAAYTLGPWLLEHGIGGTPTARNGNDFEPAALIHGVFPSAGDDRWIAIVAWRADQVERIAATLGHDDGGPLTPARLGALTAGRDADELATALQGEGIDAYAVLDLVDVCADPQLIERDHFIEAPHPVHGSILLERSAFRIEDRAPGPLQAGPLLGHDTIAVLTDVLGLDPDAIDWLHHAGVLR